MILKISTDVQTGSKTALQPKSLIAMTSLIALSAIAAALPVAADSVHFRYNGGHWSRQRHSGWHRYWGGPTIGFYYAPSPVYVVSGYPDPYYYRDSEFWYSDPSFGLRLNYDDGGYYRRPYRPYRGPIRYYGNGYRRPGHDYNDGYRRREHSSGDGYRGWENSHRDGYRGQENRQRPEYRGGGHDRR